MATIKYKDENGNLVSLGAGLHTHSPSSIGAAEKYHGHLVATDIDDGFMSATDKVALDETAEAVAQLGILVGNTPVNEQISDAMVTRVEVVPGKGLSTEDYTTAEKTKLASIEEGANNYSLPTASKNTLGGVKTSSEVTSTTDHTACPIINGVPYYKDTNTKNTAGSTDTSSKIYLVGATSQASSTQTYSHDTVYVGTDGCLYSNSKKVSIEGHTHTVDNALSDTSTNPVQNKVVYAIDQKVGPDPVNEQISSAIASLINGAPGTLDTLGEIAAAMKNNPDIVQVLETAISQKADATDVDARFAEHAAIQASTSAAGHMSATDKTKLDGIATGANKYSLPTASSSTLGGVKIGTGLSISSGKVSVSNPLPTVTTSNNGQFLRVVSGAWAAVTIKTAESEAL